LKETVVLMKENSTAKADKPAPQQAKEEPKAQKREAAEQQAQKGAPAKKEEKKAEAQEKPKGKKPRKAEEKKEQPKRDLVLERVMVIPLDKAYKGSKAGRLYSAVRILRKSVARHAKCTIESVRISVKVNELIRARGSSAIPKTVKVRIAKDKQGIVTAELAK
jgi:ribosomal protein L31E